jgi:hypothetical protein
MGITVVTAADHRMKEYVKFSIEQVKRLGYNLRVFDLGGLEFGWPYHVDSALFAAEGYYGVINEKANWKSRALHKPDILIRAFDTIEEGEWVIYLDADAALLKAVPEIVGDYDIGVTVRPDKVYGGINAGVLFLRKTERVREFLLQWQQQTLKDGNDQIALQKCTQKCMNSFSLCVHMYHCRYYNYFNFPEWPGEKVKIVHFKGHARPFFPEFKDKFNPCVKLPPEGTLT